MKKEYSVYIKAKQIYIIIKYISINAAQQRHSTC